MNKLEKSVFQIDCKYFIGVIEWDNISKCVAMIIMFLNYNSINQSFKNTNIAYNLYDTTSLKEEEALV